MNPAMVQLVIALLGQIPSLFAAAQSIRADLSQTDQASLDAAITAAATAANAHVQQLVADAGEAS